MAENVSSWSKDNSTKVGAVIVTKEGDPVSFGFNGLPRGVKEMECRHERPNKYDFFEHAERNAIYLSRRDLRGCVMFCTHFPCPDCARAIIQTGISTLVYYDYPAHKHENGSSLICTKKQSNSMEMFMESNVTVIGKIKND
jgi:dCMP deaminase